eukprot:TRINITY_DN1954_c0_g1_i2.p1 TRINITY_DN1954_c0_g1~~TRINITY_DN1954_c0_g1_i2.p1  ORF type:complete len:112 (-),score=18.93 TRINITY_DN1954_c0_g1_i2:1262-1597(-)
MIMGELDQVSLAYDRLSPGGKVLKKGQKRQGNVVNKRPLVPPIHIPGNGNLAKLSAARRQKMSLGNHRTIPGNKRGQVKIAVFKSVLAGAQTVFSSAVEGLRFFLNNETAR